MSLERIKDCLHHEDTSEDDTAEIILAASRLVGSLYKSPIPIPVTDPDFLFILRKRLEGIFGHDLPK